MFRRFKENISAARETYTAAQQGVRSLREAYRKAEPLKKAAWLVVPALILAEAVGSYFSLAWYAKLLLAVVLIAVVIRLSTHGSSPASNGQQP